MDEQRSGTGPFVIALVLLLLLVFALMSGDNNASYPISGGYNDSYNYTYTETHNTHIRICGIIVNGNC